MTSEPERLVLQLLHDMRADIAGLRADMATKSDMAEIRSEMHSLRADVASDLLALEARQAAEHKQTREQIVGLRRALVEYHTTVIGRGILISDLEARLRRVEQHLDLPAARRALTSRRTVPIPYRPRENRDRLHQ